MEESVVGRWWAPAHKEYKDVVLPQLKPLVGELREKAQAGDQLCKTIMANYSILSKAFDPIYYRVLKEKFETYLKIKGASSG